MEIFGGIIFSPLLKRFAKPNLITNILKNEKQYQQNCRIVNKFQNFEAIPLKAFRTIPLRAKIPENLQVD